MHLKRTISKEIAQVSKHFKVVMLTGPRQVGKTTCLASIVGKKRTYVTLDSADALTLAQTDPVLFFQKYPLPILIDEVQRAPSLFLQIKYLADSSPLRGQFWLTGSQQFHLMHGLSDSLAGRVGILEMQGLSQGEKIKDSTRPPFCPNLPLRTKRPADTLQQLFQKIQFGSFPQLIDGTPWHTFYSSYLKTYIQRDVREITQVVKESEFMKFLCILAARTSQLLNYHSIARDVGVNTNTIKNWVSILETSRIIYLLQPHYTNLTKRATKTPKLYFLDTGLCCFLCKIGSAQQAMDHNMSGALVETYTVSEILKSYWHNGHVPHLFFYRDSLGKEIDLLLERDGKIFPMEIKQSASPHPRMSKNFSIIPDSIRGTGAILCLAEQFIPMSADLYSIPISFI